MGRKKKLLLLAAGLLVVLGVVGKLFMDRCFIMEGRAYPRYAQQLDLRGRSISPELYRRLREQLPDCEILWEIPFQGEAYPQDIRELTITALTEEDLDLLDFFSCLETVNAQGCREYARLAELQTRQPEVEVNYTVNVDGRECPQDTMELSVAHLTEEDIRNFQYLPQLRRVDGENCTDYALLLRLQATYPECAVSYRVPVSGEEYAADITELNLTEPQVSELVEKLAYFPKLQRVTMVNPIGGAETLLALQEQYPQIGFTWQKDVFGIIVTSEDTQVDLSGTALETTEAVEAVMAYFPNVETVILCDCGIDNETMAAFREKMRQEYKVVWSVEVGQMTVRTDETTFMPGKYSKGLVNDEGYNLRYCEDMICIDVGHRAITDCEWAAFMPNLQYLILADTCVSDLSPLAGLENLIFLEAFLTQVTDYSPLLTCTSLEDLNISYTYGDAKPLMQMNWLKRLWWADSKASAAALQEALPDTELMLWTISSTGLTWRQGQNYYDMRDILGVPYMWG